MEHKKYKDYNKNIDGILYKKCKICEQWLETNLDNFGKDKNRKDGFNDCCRKCRSKEGHDRYILNIDKYKENMTQKIINNQIYNSQFNDYIIEGDITKIIMVSSKGYERITLIDTDELERIKALGMRWYERWDKNTKAYYARSTRWEMIDGKSKLVSYGLHTLIIDTKKGYYVDHKNHDRLDNRKENLRISTMPENAANRKSKNSNNKSGYRNVFWNSQREKWQVSICKNYKHIIIGYFDDVDEAGRVAEEARRNYFGKFAGLS